MPKSVLLNLPIGKQVILTGSDKDKSIIGAIEHSNGSYEPHVMDALPATIQEDFVCLDVGANIGALSLAFAAIAREGHVVSIEAGSANFDYLCTNIRNNGFDNITPVNKAVADYNGVATFNYVEEVAGCSFISPIGVTVGEQETVTVTTIDNLVEKLCINRLDFMKMDVEGGERKALAGAMKTIERFRPILLIEWNPKTILRFYGEEPIKLFLLLSENWRRIEVLRENERISVTSYQELCMITDAGKGWEDLLCSP